MKLGEMIDFRAAPVIPSYADVRKFVNSKMVELKPTTEEELITKAQEILALPRFNNVPIKLKQKIISDVVGDWFS